MGYNVDWSLEVEASLIPISADDFHDKLNDLSGYDWDCLTMNGYPPCFEIYSVRWHESEKHMEELSKMFPDARLSVNATGEDGERWIIDAFGGQIDVRNSKIIWEERKLW